MFAACKIAANTAAAVCVCVRERAIKVQGAKGKDFLFESETLNLEPLLSDFGQMLSRVGLFGVRAKNTAKLAA